MEQGRSFVLYEAGAEGKGVWYNVPLYTLSDPAPPRNVVAATTDDSGTSLFCMALMTDTTSSTLSPEELLQTL